MSDESEGMPLDGDAELTVEERKALRRLIRDDERASWAWKRIKVVTPAAVGVVVALWQAWDWARAHIRMVP